MPVGPMHIMWKRAMHIRYTALWSGCSSQQHAASYLFDIFLLCRYVQGM